METEAQNSLSLFSKGIRDNCDLGLNLGSSIAQMHSLKYIQHKLLLNSLKCVNSGLNRFKSCASVNMETVYLWNILCSPKETFLYHEVTLTPALNSY